MRGNTPGRSPRLLPNRVRYSKPSPCSSPTGRTTSSPSSYKSWRTSSTSMCGSSTSAGDTLVHPRFEDCRSNPAQTRGRVRKRSGRASLSWKRRFGQMWRTKPPKFLSCARRCLDQLRSRSRCNTNRRRDYHPNSHSLLRRDILYHRLAMSSVRKSPNRTDVVMFFLLQRPRRSRRSAAKRMDESRPQHPHIAIPPSRRTSLHNVAITNTGFRCNIRYVDLQIELFRCLCCFQICT